MCLPWEQRVELGMSLDLMGNRSRCEIVSDLAYRAIPNIDLQAHAFGGDQGAATKAHLCWNERRLRVR